MEQYANKEIPTRPVEKASITDEIKNVRDNIGDTWRSIEYRKFPSLLICQTCLNSKSDEILSFDWEFF